jgi:hypothetical protein
MCDFALVCITHGKVDIFQGTGIEIQSLDPRDDGGIGNDQCVKLVDEIEVGEDEVPAIVSNCCWFFFGWLQEGLSQSTHEKVDDVVLTIRLLVKTLQTRASQMITKPFHKHSGIKDMPRKMRRTKANDSSSNLSSGQSAEAGSGNE